MSNLLQEILSLFERHQNLYVHATWEPSQFNYAECENVIKLKFQLHCPHATYSSIILNQLTELYGSGFVEICGYKYPYLVPEIFKSIEQIVNNKCKPKPFQQKESKLRGKNIFHTHHAQNHYKMFNCIRYLKRNYTKEEDIKTEILKLKERMPDRDDYLNLFAHNVFMRSLSWDKKTGEWVVYQKIDNQYHFLCLYVHDDGSDENEEMDSRLFNLIKDHLLCT